VSITSNSNYVHARILRINVGFILAETVGFNHPVEFHVPSPLRVSDDILLNHFYASLQLSRTREGILVQGNVQTSVPSECSRCNDDILLPIEFEIQELYSTIPDGSTEFIVGEDCILDLAPLIREETVLNTPMVVPVREEDGRCLLCERTFKEVLRDYGLLDEIDPRFQVLLSLRDELSDEE
jgi:uncharacterized metal-binding protein YceD (DUF177 family)